MGAKLRQKYSDLRVYAFATPAGLLSRDAARYTESFVFTVGIGDDFVMRLGVESIENLRTSVIETIRACKFPKWRIMLNGVGYVFFGVPSKDLEKTWKNVTEIEVPKGGQSPLLGDRQIQTILPTVILIKFRIFEILIDLNLCSQESALFSREISKRRFCKTRLFIAGRVLHIVRRKRTDLEKYVLIYFIIFFSVSLFPAIFIPFSNSFI